MLIDDGLASGVTMRAAIAALQRCAVSRTVVAVPTAHASAAEPIAHVVEAVYCANLRAGLSFAVADAYVQWSDVTESETLALLRMQRSLKGNSSD